MSLLGRHEWYIFLQKYKNWGVFSATVNYSAQLYAPIWFPSFSLKPLHLKSRTSQLACECILYRYYIYTPYIFPSFPNFHFMILLFELIQIPSYVIYFHCRSASPFESRICQCAKLSKPCFCFSTVLSLNHE